MRIGISQFHPLALSFGDLRTYFFCALFVAGNILLPQLCHLMPEGGKIWLPIYFFTLIAAYKFGLKAGVMTAVFSVTVNHVLFGMPPVAVLPVLLIKSGLLAFAAAWVAGKFQTVSVFHLVGVVLAYQILGGLAEWAISGELSFALQDFRLGFPGMLFQIFAGWGILRGLADYEVKKF